jgi:hypothetical protein
LLIGGLTIVSSLVVKFRMPAPSIAANC